MPQRQDTPKASMAGTFLMTPEQHRRQAARLRAAKDPKAHKLADEHELLAKAIEARLMEVSQRGGRPKD